MEWYWHALVLFGMVVGFLLLGMPVAFGLGLAGVVGTLIFLSPAQLIQMGHIAFGRGTENVFIVAPLFILMAGLVARSGVAEQAFRASTKWLNWVPGSLAAGTVLACTAFAAVSGSSPLTAATIGYVAVPEMLKHQYDKRLAVGAVSAGGTLGILIPPSVVMIIFGVITETSIAHLFIAGVIPGLVLSALLILYVIVRCKLNPSLAPAGEPTTWRERWRSLRGIWAILLLFAGVMGSMYLGIATPTEAAAVGAGGALALALFYRQMTWQRFWDVLVKSAQTTAMVVFLIIGGFTLSYVLSALGVAHGVVEDLLGAGVRPWQAMLVYTIVLLILGGLMDPVSMIVITLPLAFPVLKGMGYDPLWLGVVVTILVEIGMITPPVALNNFILQSVVPKEVTGDDIVMGSLSYVGVLLVGMLLVMAFPSLSTWLPSLMY